MKQEGVKEEERPIGEAKWEQPSSEEGKKQLYFYVWFVLFL